MSDHGPPFGLSIDPEFRLSLDDTFQFECGPGVSCFTACCGKLELLLTPYDVVRLRTGLGLSSSEFLERYTLTRMRTSHGFPEVMMEMDRESDKRCPFVTPQGCSIYEHRPAACRIYPLGRASTKHPLHDTPQEFFFTVREDHCRGFEEPKVWKVRDWLKDQDLVNYNRMNDLLMEIFVLKARRKNLTLTPQHVQMYMMACYHTERFRDFIFKSGFLDRFEMDEDLVQTLKQDDTQLLEFAFQWLKFALFQEPTLKIKNEAANKAEERLKEKEAGIAEDTIRKNFRG